MDGDEVSSRQQQQRPRRTMPMAQTTEQASRTTFPRTPGSGIPRSKSLVLDEAQIEMPDVHSCIGSMQQGITMLKVKGPGHAITRMFFLDQDRCSIRWKPSRKADAKILIDSIREIREGACTDTFHKCFEGQYDPGCCFSIIHGNQCEVLDLVARQREDVTEWIAGLKFLLAGVTDEDSHTRQQRLRDQWLKSTFKSADKSGDGLLSISEVITLLRRLNVNLSKRKVKQMFKEADTNTGDQNEGLLDFDEFVNFYKRISTRKELYMLLLRYGNGKEYMTASELAHFLEVEQNMFNVSLRHCLDIIKNFEPVPENVHNGWLGIDGFSRFLLSREGDIFNPKHSRVHQDMSRPLSQYYIATSHNTYLLGDQLLSKSSMDVYAFVLQSGCRCVEVDCWDGPDGEPVVYHGYTLTSKILFKNVIQTINKYAFVSSPYPVIISLENHCCLQQQKKMAVYMVEVFGDKLDLEPLDSRAKYLPSPEQLKYKILIKAKKLPPDLDEEVESGEVSDEDSADEMDEQFKLKDSIRCMQVESLARAKLASLAKESASPTRRINFKFPRMSPSKRSRSKSFSEGALPDADTAQYLQAQRTYSPKEGKRRTSLSATFGKLKLSKKKRSSLPALEPMESHTEESLTSAEYAAAAKLQQGKLKLRSRRTSEIAMQNKLRRNSDTASSGSSASSSRENLDAVGQRRKQSLSYSKKNVVMLSRQLSDLVKYTMSVGFIDFTYNTPCWELPSFGESKAFQLAVNKAPQWSHFNKRKLSRAYPAAYRIDSSNFNPQPMWNCGVQLVALNYQTDGKAMQVNNAKFSANGQCGFILKPGILCDENYMFEPHSTEPFPNVARKQLILRVISGQQLPKPPQSILGERGEIIDPYVEVEIVGIPIDCARRQTQTIQDNGFNPIWDEMMTFTLNLPELALVRFLVWDEDPIGRDFIGQKTLPFPSLVQGYRHIHLEGLNQASIFVHVSISDLSDKPKRKSLKKKSQSKPTLTRQMTIDNPEGVTTVGRKSSFINRLKRRSSAPNMLNGSSRRPRTPIMAYDEPPSSAMKHNSNDENDKVKHTGKPKKKTVTFVTPVTYILPPSVDNWLKERTSTYVGPNEIRMLLFHMAVQQLLTAIREDQLHVTVAVEDVYKNGMDVRNRKPPTPPSYEEAIKRSRLYRRHRVFSGMKPHVRRELSSSMSSMSTVLPETPTSTTDSHDSSSVTSTDSARHARRQLPRIMGYKPVAYHDSSNGETPVRYHGKKLKERRGRIELLPSKMTPLNLQIPDSFERVDKRANPAVIEAASALLMLQESDTNPTKWEISTILENEGEHSSASEYRETDTFSDLTSTSSSSIDKNDLFAPNTLDTLRNYTSESESDTDTEHGLIISEAAAMQHKWNRVDRKKHSESEARQVYRPPVNNNTSTSKNGIPGHKIPHHIFGVFCKPKIPEEMKAVQRNQGLFVKNNNARTTRRSFDKAVESQREYNKFSKTEAVMKNSSFESRNDEAERKNSKDRSVIEGKVYFPPKKESEPIVQNHNSKTTKSKPASVNEEQRLAPSMHAPLTSTPVSENKTVLKAVSPEMSINVTATDNIWNECLPTSSDSEDNLSISTDSSPNVTLDNLDQLSSFVTVRQKRKHLSPHFAQSEFGDEDFGFQDNNDDFGFQGNNDDFGFLTNMHEMNASKYKAKNCEIQDCIEKNGDVCSEIGSSKTQEWKRVPVRDMDRMTSINRRSSQASDGTDTKSSPSSLLPGNRNPALDNTSSPSSTAIVTVNATSQDSIWKEKGSPGSDDTMSTSSSSSADTVVDMSIECLGRFAAEQEQQYPHKAASLDSLMLRDIFDQSEYQAFVNHMIRKKQNVQSNDVTVSPLTMKRSFGLPRSSFHQVHRAKLRKSVPVEVKKKSASTTSLVDQLRKLTNFDEDDNSEGETNSHGHQETKPAGHQTTNTPRDQENGRLPYLQTKPPGHRATNTPGHRATNTPGYRETEIPGYRATNTPGHRATDTPGYRETKIPGYRETKTPRHVETRPASHQTTNTPGHQETKVWKMNDLSLNGKERNSKTEPDIYSNDVTQNSENRNEMNHRPQHPNMHVAGKEYKPEYHRSYRNHVMTRDKPSTAPTPLNIHSNNSQSLHHTSNSQTSNFPRSRAKMNNDNHHQNDRIHVRKVKGVEQQSVQQQRLPQQGVQQQRSQVFSVQTFGPAVFALVKSPTKEANSTSSRHLQTIEVNSASNR